MGNKQQQNQLRLLMPQWQGGMNMPYVLGAQLLNWLAPEHNGPFEEVPIELDSSLEEEQGIVAKGVLLKQTRSARQLIEKHDPDSIVVFGGDCSVDLAPMAYLNDKYDGDTALVWVDSHPDVSLPGDIPNYNAHVLANLLGVGDEDFVNEVHRPFKPEQILYVGLNDMLYALETDPIKNMNLTVTTPEDIKKNSSEVLEWLEARKPSKVLIHFDLDVLDFKEFRSLLPANPSAYEDMKEKVPEASSMETIIRVLQDVGQAHDVVGLGITEHFPWDAYNLKNMLERLPLIGDANNTEKPKVYWPF